MDDETTKRGEEGGREGGEGKPDTKTPLLTHANRYRIAFKSEPIMRELKYILEHFAAPLTMLFGATRCSSICIYISLCLP